MKTRDLVVMNINALMRSSGIGTQAALSKKSGVAQSHISRILRRESDPTTEMLDSLASALGVSTLQLVSDASNTQTNPEATELTRTIEKLTASGRMSPDEIKAMNDMLKARR